MATSGSIEIKLDDPGNNGGQQGSSTSNTSNKVTVKSAAESLKDCEQKQASSVHRPDVVACGKPPAKAGL